MELAWQKLDMAIDRMETYQKHHDQLKADLSSIEQKIGTSMTTDIDEIRLKLDQLSDRCQTLSLPREEMQAALERIHRLKARLYVRPSSSTKNGFHQPSKRQVGRMRENAVVARRVELVDRWLIDANKCVFLYDRTENRCRHLCAGRDESH